MELEKLTWTTERTFEERFEALEDAGRALDEGYARKLIAPLGNLALSMAGSAVPIVVATRTFVAALVLDLQARGFAALENPQAPWGPGEPALSAAQGLLDGRNLALAGYPELGALFESYSLESLDYRTETVLQSVVEAVSYTLDWTLEHAKQEALTSLEPEVTAAPKSRMGTRYSYTVRHGDTLPYIARAIYGNENEVGRVIAAFDLYPPFLSDDFRPGTLTPGQQLLLPQDSALIAQYRYLGETLALDRTLPGIGGQEFDLVLEPNGEIAVSWGLDGLATDLALRLATPLGSLSGEPRYGVQPIGGIPMTLGSAGRTMLLTELLLEDDRVADVRPRAKRATPEGVLLGDVVAIPKQAAR